jgi:hypothetical protein
MKKPKENVKYSKVTIRSSAAEYLTFIAATGDNPDSMEMRYEDENVWLTQKMMAELYAVDVRTINEHLLNIFADNELIEISTIRKFQIVQMATEHELLTNAGTISMEVAKQYAETEWEKYRIVQDRLFESDFDRFLQLNSTVKRLTRKEAENE